ncbi:thioredoxin domain-containing protein [Streptacidiphilus sp. PB12-B1b]|uniref:DsbA family protein n=1 Tax=Streptacidiphilus sp. PB12-B1b TaxID=2705012 RepID=UPI0015FC9A4A|nr:thioredoxin domain-containing protein [Streptacidiphilus sp. PB12-B1b]QMU78650.1 thioredoxin domain-containing protein [Streptacidiphilus sp. PB12-B1b]
MKRSEGKNRKPRGTEAQGNGGATGSNSVQEANHSPVLRWVVIGGMVLAVFIVAGLVGSFVRGYKERKLAPPASAAGPSALAVPVYGHASVTLTVFEDMQDPASLQFSQTYDPTLAHLIASGTVNVYYREVAGMDATEGGSGSLYAGNALACAQDAKDFPQYRTVLLANQPAGGTTFTKSHLIELSKQVPGLDTDVFRACVNAGTHNVWVKDSTSAFKKLDQGGVPVLTMSVLPQTTDQYTAILSSTLPLTTKQLEDKVYAAARTAPTTSPSATPSS